MQGIDLKVQRRIMESNMIKESDDSFDEKKYLAAWQTKTYDEIKQILIDLGMKEDTHFSKGNTHPLNFKTDVQKLIYDKLIGKSNEAGSTAEQDIAKYKKALIAKAKQKGIWENFGQKEVRALEDKYGTTPEIMAFADWAENFDLSQIKEADNKITSFDDFQQKETKKFKPVPTFEAYVTESEVGKGDQGGISDAVWKTDFLQRYIDGNGMDGLGIAGYVGDNYRTEENDKALEQILRDAGFRDKLIAFFLISQAGRYCADRIAGGVVSKTDVQYFIGEFTKWLFEKDINKWKDIQDDEKYYTDLYESSNINTWDDLSGKAGLTAQEERDLQNLVNQLPDNEEFRQKLENMFSGEKLKVLLDYYAANPISTNEADDESNLDNYNTRGDVYHALADAKIKPSDYDAAVAKYFKLGGTEVSLSGGTGAIDWCNVGFYTDFYNRRHETQGANESTGDLTITLSDRFQYNKVRDTLQEAGIEATLTDHISKKTVSVAFDSRVDFATGTEALHKKGIKFSQAAKTSEDVKLFNQNIRGAATLEKGVNEAKPPVDDKVITIDCEYAMSATSFLRKYAKLTPAQIRDDDFYDKFADSGAVKALQTYLEQKATKHNCKIGSVSFVETDSSNMLNAAAYYHVTISGKQSDLKKIAGEDKDLSYQWDSNEAKKNKRSIRAKAKLHEGVKPTDWIENDDMNELYDYIVDSSINGAISQAKEIMDKMDTGQQIAFKAWLIANHGAEDKNTVFCLKHMDMYDNDSDDSSEAIDYDQLAKYKEKGFTLGETIRLIELAKTDKATALKELNDYILGYNRVKEAGDTMIGDKSIDSLVDEYKRAIEYINTGVNEAASDERKAKFTLTSKYGDKYKQEWFLTSCDTTHFYLSNTPQSKGQPHHVAEYKDQAFYKDLEAWCAGKGEINDKSYQNTSESKRFKPLPMLEDFKIDEADDQLSDEDKKKGFSIVRTTGKNMKSQQAVVTDWMSKLDDDTEYDFLVRTAMGQRYWLEVIENGKANESLKKIMEDDVNNAANYGAAYKTIDDKDSVSKIYWSLELLKELKVPESEYAAIVSKYGLQNDAELSNRLQKLEPEKLKNAVAELKALTAKYGKGSTNESSGEDFQAMVDDLFANSNTFMMKKFKQTTPNRYEKVCAVLSKLFDSGKLKHWEDMENQVGVNPEIGEILADSDEPTNEDSNKPKISDLKKGDLLKKKGSAIELEVVEIGKDGDHDYVKLYNDVTDATDSYIDLSNFVMSDGSPNPANEAGSGHMFGSAPKNLEVGKTYTWTGGAEMQDIKYIGKRSENPDIKVGSSVGKGHIFQWPDQSYFELSNQGIQQDVIEKTDSSEARRPDVEWDEKHPEGAKELKAAYDELLKKDLSSAEFNKQWNKIAGTIFKKYDTTSEAKKFKPVPTLESFINESEPGELVAYYDAAKAAAKAGKITDLYPPDELEDNGFSFIHPGDEKCAVSVEWELESHTITISQLYGDSNKGLGPEIDDIDLEGFKDYLDTKPKSTNEATDDVEAKWNSTKKEKKRNIWLSIKPAYSVDSVDKIINAAWSDLDNKHQEEFKNWLAGYDDVQKAKDWWNGTLSQNEMNALAKKYYGDQSYDSVVRKDDNIINIWKQEGSPDAISGK